MNLIRSSLLSLAVMSFPTMAAVIIETADKQLFSIPEVNELMSIDAEFNELSWKQALKMDVDIETRPSENTPSPVKTTAWLMHDDSYIYVFIKADDPDPSSIRAHYHDSDKIWDDDVAGVKFDTYLDSRRAYQFFSNPLGVKSDSIQDELTGKDDVSWNAIWEVEGKITEQGYQLEFAIPFRIMRFEEKNSEQRWGFDIVRYQPRDLWRRYATHPVDRDISCDLCQNPILVGMTNAESGNHLEWVPYLTASSSKSRPEPLVDDWQNKGFDAEVGGDLRWGINPDTTLNLTVNPDFSQVESDVAQIDVNNSFALFYPEKRPFFLEGTDYYQSSMNLVYTRNINAPDIGAKLTHTSDGDNVGVFVANDTSTNYLLPGPTSSDVASIDEASANAVVRYRHDFEDTSSVGTLITARKSDDYHNYVYGVDGQYRVSGSAILRAQIMHSETIDPSAVVSEFNLAQKSKSGTAADVFFEHEDRDWLWWTRYKNYDDNFRADMGFINQVGYQLVSAGFRKFLYESDEHWWHKITTGVGTFLSRGQDNSRLKHGKHIMFKLQGPLQSTLDYRFEKGYQFWNGEVYDTRKSQLEYNIRPFPDWQLSLGYENRDTIDFENSQPGELQQQRFNSTFNLGEHFQTQFRVTHVSLDVRDGELFKSLVVDGRFIYQFSVKSYLRLIVQQHDTERNPGLYIDMVDRQTLTRATQLLYSYKFNAQTVIFAGYSDSGIEFDALQGFQKTGKTFFLKMSYSWLQ